VTREAQYVAQHIIAPARALLKDRGMQTWAWVVGPGGPGEPTCAGLLMPFLWRWEYEQVLAPVLQSRGQKAVDPILRARVNRILAIDQDLFPTFVEDQVHLVENMMNGPSDVVSADNWRYTVVEYIIRRDMTHAHRAIPHCTERGRLLPLPGITFRSQWLSAILLFHLTQAVTALPGVDPTQDIVAARDGTTGIHEAGNRIAVAPADLRTGRALDEYPLLRWRPLPMEATSVDEKLVVSHRIGGKETLVMNTHTLNRFTYIFEPEALDVTVAGVDPTTWRGPLPAAPAVDENLFLPSMSGIVTDLANFEAILRLPGQLLSTDVTDASQSTLYCPSLGCYQRVCRLLEQLVGPVALQFANKFCPTTTPAAQQNSLFGFELPVDEATLMSFKVSPSWALANEQLAERQQPGTWVELATQHEKVFQPTRHAGTVAHAIKPGLSRDAAALRETPKRWQAYVMSVSRLANTQFQALPASLKVGKVAPL